jgi:hypothetical protein
MSPLPEIGEEATELANSVLTVSRELMLGVNLRRRASYVHSLGWWKANNHLRFDGEGVISVFTAPKAPFCWFLAARIPRRFNWDRPLSTAECRPAISPVNARNGTCGCSLGEPTTGDRRHQGDGLGRR